MSPSPAAPAAPRHDWQPEEVRALFALPFGDLLFQAQSVHRLHFEPNTVQLSTLLSIKTGACPEDCAYCPQSVRFDTGLRVEPLLPLDAVRKAAAEARANGATRFCMGAAWRAPKDRDIEKVSEMVREVKALGLETCVTLGMLKAHQAQALAGAGLDYYNHNLDTSPEYYEDIISTRTYADRLETLGHVREAGLKVCSGGIVGMGESSADRAELLRQLATLPEHPESVPINELVQVEGTPLHGAAALDPLDFVRTIAVARILMPRAYVRLSAGRTQMSDETQALCFMAGANSIFYGERLLSVRTEDSKGKRIGEDVVSAMETVFRQLRHPHCVKCQPLTVQRLNKVKASQPDHTLLALQTTLKISDALHIPRSFHLRLSQDCNVCSGSSVSGVRCSNCPSCSVVRDKVRTCGTRTDCNCVYSTPPPPLTAGRRIGTLTCRHLQYVLTSIPFRDLQRYRNFRGGLSPRSMHALISEPRSFGVRRTTDPYI